MLVEAIAGYMIKLIIFGAVAVGGIFAGIKIRKAKDRKDEMKGNQQHG